MVSIRRMQPSDHAAVRALSLKQEQQRFVGIIEALLQSSGPTRLAHVIEAHRRIVGFFHIDTEYATEYEFAAPGDYGLRAFFIDDAEQGRGIGQQAVALLKDLMTAQHPEAPALTLTVNCKNPAAYRVYCTHGFIDTGHLYHGGSAGPQHILRMPLA